MKNYSNTLKLANEKSKYFNFNMPIATLLDNPKKDWSLLTGKSGVRCASKMIIDWNKFPKEEYIFTHVTALSSVNVEDNGFYIKPACNNLVNANGNSWATPVLAATYHTFKGGFNFLEHCFIAGTRVLMSDGTYKEIETLKAGDKIINRLGEIDTVKNIQIRKSNNFVKLSGKGILSRNLFVTGNHPFWTFSARKDCPKTGRPNVFPLKFNKNPKQEWTGFSIGVHKRAGEIIESGWKADWKNAENLDNTRDLLTMPISDIEIEDQEINENRAELIGWFLAEGSFQYNNHSREGEISGIQFAMHIKEQPIAERLKNLLNQEFGHLFTRSDCTARYYTKEDENGLGLYLSNKQVADLFYKWCGKYAWKKKLEEKFMFLPKKLQAIILKAFIDGDGTFKYNERGYSVDTKSKELMQQMLFISNRLGLDATYKEGKVLARYSELEEGCEEKYPRFVDPITGKKSRPGYKVSITVDDSKKLNKILNIKNAIDNRSSQNKSSVFFKDDKNYIVKQFKKENVVLDNEIDVYNIEVENDNSYIVEGVVVHNCQIESLSKGIILDAILRPVEHIGLNGKKEQILYCDLLVATERRHTDLVNKILSGEYNSLSMGCSCVYCTCSKCGKVIGDGEENCEHIDNELLTTFKDENGIERIVSELCGRMTKVNGLWVADPESVKFFEISWVANPAFKGAVVNHTIEFPDAVNKVAAYDKEAIWNYSLESLRVADTYGMLALKVAKEEMKRQRMIQLIDDVTQEYLK